MFDFISPLWGWLGLGGGVIAGALAIAWFFPPFRKYALAAAGAVAGALYLYGRGYKDAEGRKQREWDNAIERDVQKGRKARDDAERTVDAGGVSDDKWNRDKSGL